VASAAAAAAEKEEEEEEEEAAAATGAPIHVFSPPGGHQKLTKFQIKLAAAGAVRLWRGRLEEWRYQPINTTPMIAQSVISAYNQYLQHSPAQELQPSA
jgi:mitochondrial fission protein ELM1